MLAKGAASFYVQYIFIRCMVIYMSCVILCYTALQFTMYMYYCKMYIVLVCFRPRLSPFWCSAFNHCFSPTIKKATEGVTAYPKVTILFQCANCVASAIIRSYCPILSVSEALFAGCSV